ncbi:hypothetical protein P7K49_024418, partial [Saguinus oedipus]
LLRQQGYAWQNNPEEKVVHNEVQRTVPLFLEGPWLKDGWQVLKERVYEAQQRGVT